MPETLITPTPERGQHDTVIVEPAGKNHVARQRVVDPFYEDWLKRGILTETQAHAAKMFVEDHEQLNRGIKSCLAALDRVDNAAGGLVTAEQASQAQARIDAVRASLGPDAYDKIYCILIYGMKPSNALNKHNQVSQGMVVMALEVMVQVYGLRS